MYFTPFCLLTVGETLPLLNIFTISPSLAELRYCALSAQARWCPLRPSRGDCPFVALRSTDIRCFMQHNFLFPKVASPSQCASLRHDVGHCTCSLALLPFFSGHFRHAIRYGSLSRRPRNLYKILPIYSSSIWHKTFDPPHRVPATIWRNPRQQNHSPAMQVRAPDTALPSVVEDIKTIL